MPKWWGHRPIEMMHKRWIQCMAGDSETNSAENGAKSAKVFLQWLWSRFNICVHIIKLTTLQKSFVKMLQRQQLFYLNIDKTLYIDQNASDYSCNDGIYWSCASRSEFDRLSLKPISKATRTQSISQPHLNLFSNEKLFIDPSDPIRLKSSYPIRMQD